MKTEKEYPMGTPAKITSIKDGVIHTVNVTNDGDLLSGAGVGFLSLAKYDRELLHRIISTNSQNGLDMKTVGVILPYDFTNGEPKERSMFGQMPTGELFGYMDRETYSPLGQTIVNYGDFDVDNLTNSQPETHKSRNGVVEEAMDNTHQYLIDFENERIAMSGDIETAEVVVIPFSKLDEYDTARLTSLFIDTIDTVYDRDRFVNRADCALHQVGLMNDSMKKQLEHLKNVDAKNKDNFDELYLNSIKILNNSYSTAEVIQELGLKDTYNNYLDKVGFFDPDSKIKSRIDIEKGDEEFLGNLPVELFKVFEASLKQNYPDEGLRNMWIDIGISQYALHLEFSLLNQRDSEDFYFDIKDGKLFGGFAGHKETKSFGEVFGDELEKSLVESIEKSREARKRHIEESREPFYAFTENKRIVELGKYLTHDEAEEENPSSKFLAIVNADTVSAWMKELTAIKNNKDISDEEFADLTFVLDEECKFRTTKESFEDASLNDNYYWALKGGTSLMTLWHDIRGFGIEDSNTAKAEIDNVLDLLEKLEENLKSEPLSDYLMFGRNVYTIEEYDEEGKEVRYGSKEANARLVVHTENRYASKDDLWVEQVDLDYTYGNVDYMTNEEYNKQLLERRAVNEVLERNKEKRSKVSQQKQESNQKPQNKG